MQELIMNTKQEDFFYGLFKPNKEKTIESNAYLLMGQYLIQIENKLDELSMPRKELAKKINVSASYLSQIFNFNKLLNFKILAKIELELNIKFKLLL